MKVLICNAGSTSLKFKLWLAEEEKVLASGKVERIGMGNSIFGYQCPCRRIAVEQEGLDIGGYTQGVDLFLKYLTGEDTGAVASLEEIEAVGFKTVLSKGHMGVHLLTEEVLQGMRDYMTVAPAHNGPYLEAIEVFARLMPGAPLVGAFETAFHQTIPQYRRCYALPQEWVDKYGLYKMGYHGASHGFVALETGEKGRVVSCHLGGSASICAIQDGRSVDNSFGLSLQTGIPHNNRVGDLDPYMLIYLLRQGVTLDELEKGLTRQAGLKGVSGLSGDMRDIEKAMDQGDSRAKLAFDMFVDSVKRYIGAYSAEMGGLDQLAFTGGIGENSSRVRQSVCEGLEYLGIKLDEKANRELKGRGLISRPDSPVKVWVIPANEELMVVRRVVSCLAGTRE